MHSSSHFIVAHRGLRAEFPENTIPAIEAAIKLPGLSAVEFDVELSDRPVVLHQETVVPSADFSRLEQAERNYTTRDWVSQHPAHKIIDLDAGSWRGESFSDLRVPLLQDVLDLDWGEKVACVELKDPTFWGERDLSRPEKVLKAVLPLLEAFPGQLNILSFNPEILKAVHAALPRLPLTLPLWLEWAGRAEEAVCLARDVGASAIGLPDRMVLADPGWLDVVRRRSLEILVYPVTPAYGEENHNCWTADSQRATWKQLLQIGIKGIVSDFGRETVEFFRDSKS